MFEDLVKENKRYCPYCDIRIRTDELVCINCWDELLTRVRSLKKASEELMKKDIRRV